MLAEDRRLEYLPLGPQDAFVAVPPLAVADEARGQTADPPVEPERLLRADVWLMEVLGGVLARPQRVVQPAGHDHAPAPGAEPAPRVVLIEPRRDRARIGDPGKRGPAKLAASDIEGPVDHDIEGEARAGPELQQPDAATEAVAQRDESDAGDLVEPADAAKELGAPELTTEEGGHGMPLSFPSTDRRSRATPPRAEGRPGAERDGSARSAHHSPLRASSSSDVAGRSEAPSAAACIQSV